MPVHTIDTGDMHLMFWYANMGCIAFEKRLYFVRSYCPRQQIILTHIVKNKLEITQVAPLIRISHQPQWPIPHWALVFFADLAHPPANLCHTEHLSFTTERTWNNHKISFIDEINPALRRLQRWFRAYTRQRRWKASSLAFLLGTIPRLGDSSPISLLVPELAGLIVRELNIST